MQRNRSITRSPRPAAQAGFSLIEIIIVTVLIGGIVAFAASRILGGGDKARYRLAQSMVQTMAEKVHSYQIGRASGRERVCQYVYVSVVAVSLKKNIKS